MNSYLGLPVTVSSADVSAASATRAARRFLTAEHTVLDALGDLRVRRLRVLTAAGEPASSIPMGRVRVPLDHHVAIEYGLAAGLLALVPLEYGGQLTTSFPDPTQLAVACEPTGVVDVGAMARTTVGTLSIRHADMKLVGERSNSPVAPGARRIRVSCERLAFSPAEIRVKAGEDVAIELVAADVMHNFVLEEFGAYVQADAGRSAVGGFRAGRPGVYEFHCSLMAHRAAGMTGRLVVEP
ncbi:plastocyanin/azurin family copper-binding protein [Thermoactinospora rubra]|uniref:plastocyanin/azurin family copper-binding protein n=1 Tax=Thermoactinospora rubra TaxID=1088767 RepID=UPI000A10EE8E|nr:plastocyanin/azurin family copper-binding protein [Thermoactinospora rubra]